VSPLTKSTGVEAGEPGQDEAEVRLELLGGHLVAGVSIGCP
jgi:hypothetical protein